MFITASKTRTAPAITRTGSSPVAWLLRWNAAWRERQAIARLDADQLADLGLTRAQADGITLSEILAR